MASDEAITDKDLRLLLVGRTGHGKSETGNSILGSEAFISKHSIKSVTRECGWKKAEIDGKRIEIVDTPGLKDTIVDEADIKRELYRALIFSSPGFHAVALVIKPDRFTDEMKQVFDVFFDFFGDDVEKYAFVIFTNTDTQSKLIEFLDIDDDDSGQPPGTDAADFTVDDKLIAALTKNDQKIDPTLKTVFEKCGKNIAIINNMTKNEEQKNQQVKAIINEIHKIKDRTGNSYFTNAKFLSIDLLLQKEEQKAVQAKEQGMKHYPWAWMRSENSKEILEKVLQDAMEKEREHAKNEEKGRRAFEEQLTAKANELEEQLKKERLEREREQKELEEKQREFIENMERETERMKATMNKHEKEMKTKELEQRGREMQIEEQQRKLKERERNENDRREQESRARERERLEFEHKMNMKVKDMKLEMERERAQDQEKYELLKNSKEILEKLLQDAMEKEREHAENEEKERRAFEEQLTPKANELEEQLKKERLEREREQKELEEKQREFMEIMERETERMKATMNKYEKEMKTKELEQRGREMQFEEQQRKLKERERNENDRREQESRARERERLEFEHKMNMKVKDMKLEMERERAQDQEKYDMLKNSKEILEKLLQDAMEKEREQPPSSSKKVFCILL